MYLAKPIPVKEIARFIGAEVVGDTSLRATSINEIHKVEPGSVVFVGHPKYLQKALTSAATIVITQQAIEVPAGKCLLLHHNPFGAYNQLVNHYYPYPKAFNQGKTQKPIVDASSQIHPSVTMGEGVHIGKDCVIYPNVVLYDNVHIGDRVVIQAGAIIGGQAFYYDKQGEDYVKWTSCGWVSIEDDVEIGAGTTIDKGVSGITRIGKGTKIDNLVHIGHGVEIGERCLIAAQCGIGGKTIMEDEVICWGQVGITKDVTIGRGAVISAQSGVSKSLSGGKAYYGSPARELRAAQKELALLRKLPQWFDEKGKAT